ncbi:organelle RRM domain-containing protein 2, mitochondrial [Telopea speciosissima]|uniref:organelle RRM domain-containing protein 2, mitochondrial n=1 Tax=Telopea speciosissima TaxID=54955 RepID=UPI001CC74DC9|nr:organelle RRM domain-containing protein 2, mitochondrial [Telopea speciosissima]
MAFASGVRRVLTDQLKSSPLLQWRFTPIRLNSSLTTSKLFVSGLSRLTTDEKLKEAFSPFGQLLEAKVITDRTSGRSKGFGFVRYATIEEAEEARQGMNAKFLDGWVIFVDPAKPREPRSPPKPEPEPSETGFRTNKTIGWCG